MLINVPNKASLGRKWKGSEWFAHKDKTYRNILTADAWLNFINNNDLKILEVSYDGLWDVPYLPKI